MTYISEKVRDVAIVKSLQGHLVSQGKVGDKYEIPGMPECYLSVRSDRLSVFDFVLPLLVGSKGAILTSLTQFFAEELVEPMGIPHHLVYSDKFPGFNMARDIQDKYPDVQFTRSLVVRKAEIMKYELIFRHHIGGSVWGQYQKDGIVAGIKLPDGLKKWQKLDKPLFTPSTKAESGHDVNITVADFFAATGKEGRRAVDMLTELYMAAYQYASARGIAIPDTKFEVSADGRMLCDEWLTPDSSRFLGMDDLEISLAEGKEPPFKDKQPVRDYCDKIETPFFDKDGKPIVGFKGLDPENRDHVMFVSEYNFPERIAIKTEQRYLEIFKALTED